MPQRPGGRYVAPPVDGAVLAVIAVGGALGSVGRWGLARAMPATAGALPVATLLTNVLGALALGVVVVLAAEVFPHRRLLRPFLGVGVLGGFTTFSTYMVEVAGLLVGGFTPLALAYLFGSVLGGLGGLATGLTLTRAVVGPRHDRGQS